MVGVVAVVIDAVVVIVDVDFDDVVAVVAVAIFARLVTTF